MAELIDKEIDAIRVVLQSLEPLTSEVRTNVLAYVLRRLQIELPSAQQTEFPGVAIANDDLRFAVARAAAEHQTKPVHISDLKEQKKPRSAIEMATLVAYYLANLAESKDRKASISRNDMETYFKIAEFRLPPKPQFTLPNAKAAGYLDALGGGEYKLNPVGYNLVVHSMPRGADRNKALRKKPAKKTRGPAKKR